MEDRKVRIWYQTLDEDGKVIGTGVYHKAYVHMGTAANVAFKQFGGNPRIKYHIAPLNPFETNIDSMVCDICEKSFEVTVDSWGHRNCDTLSICSWSGSIPPEDGRKRFSRHCYTCPDCIVKIKNFVDSLKVSESRPVKGPDTCKSCKQYFQNCRLKCETCDIYQAGCHCKCLDIRIGDPCPYYKPTVKGENHD